jgi:hypothetical protein
MSRYSHPDDCATEVLVDAWGKSMAAGAEADGPKAAGAEASDAAASGGMMAVRGVLLVFVIAGIAVACTLAGIAIHNDHKIEDILKNDVEPALEFAYNHSQAVTGSSQSYCTESFVHVASGTAPTSFMSLFRRELAVAPVDNAETYMNSIGKRTVNAARAHTESRGFPLINTVLPGTSGMVSIVRVADTVHIKYTATGLPTNLSALVPVWEAPDTVLGISSYIPYECVPPIALWPNCNTSIPGVASCQNVLTNVINPVRTIPGHETTGAVYHTHSVNGIGWFAGNHNILTASIAANGYTDDDNTTYVIGTQTDMFSVVDGMFNGLMFTDLRAETAYKTDAPIDWAVPDACRAECVF